VLTRHPSAFPVTITEERRIDRRRFLCATGAAVLLAGTGQWLAHRAKIRTLTLPSVPRDALTDLARGDARILPRRDGETLAVRLADGSVAAFDRRCPHLGCPVVWSAEHGRFECPCHHAAFDARSGAVLFGPPERGLTPVEVRS
jgi:Rieske Fe-S protein